MKVLVAIPAYNEAQVIAGVIRDVQQKVPAADIVVIDDGSRDQTAEAATTAGAKVVRHRMNRGLGGAIGTALAWADRYGYEALVTIDADGQHDPDDITRVLHPVADGVADVVVGSRLQFTAGQMPLDRVVLNNIANWITWLFFGISTSDSQSGFRGFSKQAIREIRLKTERMEVSSEIFAEIKRLRLRYAEVPIRVIYSDYSRAKGQRNSNGFAILFRLMLRLFR